MTSVDLEMEASLLRGIIDNPEELDRRLVYSDFLEETGDPNKLARAQFICTQILFPHKLCHVPKNHIRRWFSDLFRILHWELGRCQTTYYGGRVRICKPWTASIDICNGFPQTVAVMEGQWVTLGPDLVRHYPISVVQLDGKKPIGTRQQGYVWLPTYTTWTSQFGPSILSSQIFGRLPSNERASFQTCMDRLSVACLQYARERADFKEASAGA